MCLTSGSHRAIMGIMKNPVKRKHEVKNRFDDETFAALKAEAVRQDRSVNYIVKQCIKRGLALVTAEARA